MSVTEAKAGTHVFEGKPDARQSTEVSLTPSRFRPRYRALTDEEKKLHDAIKDQAVEIERLIFAIRIPNPSPDEHPTQRIADVARYKALALTSLEESIMWAIKGLTA